MGKKTEAPGRKSYGIKYSRLAPNTLTSLYSNDSLCSPIVDCLCPEGVKKIPNRINRILGRFVSFFTSESGEVDQGRSPLVCYGGFHSLCATLPCLTKGFIEITFSYLKSNKQHYSHLFLNGNLALLLF